MAQPNKKRWAQLRVGLMAVVALSLLTFLIFLLTGSRGLFTSRTEVYTYLDDSAAIALAAPVRLNGINVGRVKSVSLSGINQTNRVVKVALEIDNNFLPSIPTDSQATIAAENLLGTKYINIKMGRAGEAIKAGSELKALDTREFDDVVQQGYATLTSLNGIFRKLDGIIDSIQVGKGTIGKLFVDERLYNQLNSIASETNKVVATLNSDQGTLGRLMHDDTLYTDFRGTVSRVNTLVDGINQGQGTAGKLLKDPAIYDDTRAAINDVRQLLAGLEKGQGTAGKLLKSDELHNELKGTMARLDTLLDKINNGQGTLGQLAVNPALYQSLDATTREMNGLLKDFRSNPKKFLRIKLGLF